MLVCLPAGVVRPAAQLWSEAYLAKFTGRTEPRVGGYNEAWLVVGRRGGKSLMMATIAVYLAVFRDWSAYTVPGESALIQVLAVDRRQARIVYRYAKAMLTRVPVLKPLVAKEQDELLELNTGISIEITTNSFRSVRGYTVVAALLDEVAYWRWTNHQPRQRDVDRAKACDVNDTRRDPDRRIIAVRQARRVVRRLPPALRQGQQRAGVEGPHPRHASIVSAGNRR